MGTTRHLRTQLVVFAAVLAFTGCGSSSDSADTGDDDIADERDDDRDDRGDDRDEPVDTTVFEMPFEPLTDTVTDVAHYGACGNETFEVDGVTWYPLPPDELRTFKDHTYEPIPTQPEGIVRVAPPAEGDDIGTLYIYGDGHARFISDSGLIDQWVTVEPREYGWVC